MKKLGDYLAAPPRPAPLEVDQRWWELRARLRRRTQIRRAAAIGTALAVVLAAGLTMRGGRDQAPEVAQGSTVTTTSSPTAVALREGTRVELQPQTQLQVAQQTSDDVLLLLDQGTARFDVVKKAGRRFIVRADDVDVQVVGTQFDVRRTNGEVAVVVYRGIVEVRVGERRHRLVAGERWSRGETAPEPEVSTATLEEETEVEEPSTPGPTPVPVRRVKRHKTAAPAPVVAAPPAPIAAPAAAVDAGPVVTARTVFDAAVQARARGEATEAIARFDELLRRWPDHPLAALSAFELGRLQMDSRHNPRAAAAAFEKVLAIASESSLKEDALGRLVEAYASFDVEACRRARTRYLSAFPAGTHAKDVTSSCPP